MRNRRYLMKCPAHLSAIDALLEVFPDADLIFLFRPLCQIIPSFLALQRVIIDQGGGTPDEQWKRRFFCFFVSFIYIGFCPVFSTEKAMTCNVLRGVKVHKDHPMHSFSSAFLFWRWFLLLDDRKSGKMSSTQKAWSAMCWGKQRSTRTTAKSWQKKKTELSPMRPHPHWKQREATQKLEMLGSIVSRLASPRKILGENFFEHSGWHKTSRNA